MLPSTYKKLIAARLSRSFREAAEIVEVELSQPGPDEILVRNYFAGVNATDPNITAGLYTPGKPLPFDLGAEAVGEVVAVGSAVTGFNVGDFVFTSAVGAGYREYYPARARFAVPIPAATPEVLTLGVSGLTASLGLELVGEMRSSETVLITAAAGGTGHIAVQLAKQAGNHVIGTCGSPEKAEMLTALGCDRVVNYRQEDLDTVLKNEYPRGVDLIYESVGRRMFDVCVDHLARRGRLVIIGYITEYSGEPEAMTGPRIYTRLLFKSASIRSMFLPHFYEQFPTHLTKLALLYQAGSLHVEIDPTEFRGVESIPDAVDYLQSGRSGGKVVIRF